MPHPSASSRLQLVPEGGSPPPALTPLEAAYRDHSRYVARLALHILGRDQDVDDLVQDVFVAAALGLERVRERTALRGWLATVTVRLARRRLRTRRLLSLFGLDPQPEYGELVSPEASPEQHALVSRVYLALDALPAQLRIVWTLRHVEGERLEALAVLCGCSLATAKRRLAAADAALEAGFGDG